MKFLIGGDFVIDDTCENEITIDSSVKKIFNDVDYRILNLEAPVTKSTSKILKSGPHLKGNSVYIKKVFEELNIDLVTLANNHILDYDEQGLLDTLMYCKDNNVDTVGAGKNKSLASKEFYIQKESSKIAIINIAENEWASAKVNKAGANGMNLIDDFEKINEAKNKGFLVFVIVHGGLEYYSLPSPQIQKQYRFYIDAGADIVVGHHTHCISGYENYKDKKIYYSLGNFLFTKKNKDENWNTGLVVEIDVLDNKVKTICHAVSYDYKNSSLGVLKGDLERNITKKIEFYNQIISNEPYLQKEWNLQIDIQYNKYLNYLSPVNFISNNYLRAFFLKLGFKFLNNKNIPLLLNLLRCETHKIVSEEVINKFLKDKK